MTTTDSGVEWLGSRQRNNVQLLTPLIWSNFLKLLTHADGRLRHPLGKWTDLTFRRWPAMYDHKRNIIKIRTASGKQYIQVTAFRTKLEQPATNDKPVGKKTCVPIDWDGVTAQVPGKSVSTGREEEEAEPAEKMTLSQFFKSLPPWEADILKSNKAVNKDLLLEILQIGGSLILVHEGRGGGGATAKGLLWMGASKRR